MIWQQTISNVLNYAMYVFILVFGLGIFIFIIFKIIQQLKTKKEDDLYDE